MKIALALALASAAALAGALTPAARAADECRGLMVCIPVAGPWVVVPAPSRAEPSPTVAYELSCPPRSVVGGLDARVSDRALDLSFRGALGSPVNPGVTTTRAAVFVATYSGTARRPSTFRPFVGCIPTSGGGGRSTTALQAFRPGEPTIRRVRTQRLAPGAARTLVARCAPGERLVSSAHAAAFRTGEQPSARWLAAVHTSRAERGGRVRVTARRSGSIPAGVRVEVQVQAVCARVAP